MRKPRMTAAKARRVLKEMLRWQREHADEWYAAAKRNLAQKDPIIRETYLAGASGFEERARALEFIFKNGFSPEED